VHASDGSYDPGSFTFTRPTGSNTVPNVVFDANGILWATNAGTLYRATFLRPAERASFADGAEAVVLEPVKLNGWVLVFDGAGNASMSSLDTQSAALTPLGWDLSGFHAQAVSAMIYVER
jgi:hypothetical protein